jgi:hypothetical protein
MKHIPVQARDRSHETLVLSDVIAALGGAQKVAPIVRRHWVTIYRYIDGSRAVPPDVAEALAIAAKAHVNRQTSNVHELGKIAAAAKGRRARIRQAARERFYQRFGHYPMPARGGKTG